MDEALSHALVVLSRAIDPLASRTSAQQALKNASETPFATRLKKLEALLTKSSSHAPAAAADTGNLLSEAAGLGRRRNAIVHGWLSLSDGQAWFHHHKSDVRTQYEESGETIRNLSDEFVDWLSRFQGTFSGFMFQYDAARR